MHGVELVERRGVQARVRVAAWQYLKFKEDRGVWGMGRGGEAPFRVGEELQAARMWGKEGAGWNCSVNYKKNKQKIYFIVAKLGKKQEKVSSHEATTLR